MLDLSPAQIHLWQYALGKPPAPEHLAYAMTLLSDAEKQRCAAFYFEKHRTEYALSHAMLRLALSASRGTNDSGTWKLLRTVSRR